MSQEIQHALARWILRFQERGSLTYLPPQVGMFPLSPYYLPITEKFYPHLLDMLS
jgi:hypothetical protein